MPLKSQEFLESRGIPFETVAFPVEMEKGVASISQFLRDRVNARQVVKSLMFETSSGEVVLVLVGGDQNVISGQLKRALGDRNIRMAAPDRIRQISGYEIGSIPPFSWQPAGFRTLIEATLLSESVLAVGAGQWGIEILLSPADLLRATQGVPVDLATRKDSPSE